MDYRLTVVADTNDADYVTETRKISEHEYDNYVIPICSAIAEFKDNVTRRDGTHYSWPASEYRTQTIYDTYPNVDVDLLEWFDDECVPTNCDGGVHSIESVTICLWMVETVLV